MGGRGPYDDISHTTHNSEWGRHVSETKGSILSLQEGLRTIQQDLELTKAGHLIWNSYSEGSVLCRQIEDEYMVLINDIFAIKMCKLVKLIRRLEDYLSNKKHDKTSIIS